MSNEWRAVKNVSYPKYWGIETTDPIAVEAGEETITAPDCLSEAAAKTIVDAHNAAVRAAVIPAPVGGPPK